MAQNAPPTSVLFVDDDEHLLATMERAACARVRVFPARDGMQARAVARRQQLDVALIDRNMPEECGFQVSSRLRRICPWIGISIVTSERITPELALDAVSHGADDCTEKPSTVSGLLETIASLARRRAKHAEQLPTIAEHEWTLVEATLRACGGNRSRAARMLGLTYNGLVKKLAKGPPASWGGGNALTAAS